MSGLPDFLDVLQAWWGEEMAAIHGSPADYHPRRRMFSKDYNSVGSKVAPAPLLMACPVWGKRYADRFSWYCLPSMLAEQNLAALRDNCRLVLFTDKHTFTHLWIAMRGLEHETGIDVILRLIPDAIMEGIHRQAKGDPVDNKYWTLGVAGQLGLQMAGRANMGFHMLLPDHLYAEAYFPTLLKIAEDYEGIAQPGISAMLPQAHDDIYKWKQPDGSLAIPDRALGAIGWRWLHPQTQANLITDNTFNDQFPLSHLWIWQGVDRLYLSSCHMNAAYLSPAMCAKAPSRIPATMDAELPAFFPEKFYVPKADDGLTYIELSDATKPHDQQRGNLAQFVSASCEKVRYSDDWLPFAQQFCEVPIDPQETYVDPIVMREQHRWMLAQLQDHAPSHKAQAAYKLIQSLAYRYG